MGAYNDNTLRIYEQVKKRDMYFIPNTPVDIKPAKFILTKDTDFASDEQWKDLCNVLFDTVLKSTPGTHIRNVNQAVLDWGKEVQDVSIAKIRSFASMASLNNWQKDLVSEFLNKDETIKIHFFKDGDADCVRVIVSNPTTSVILDYSEAYTVFLENYSDMYLDFLVLGENEIRDFSKVPGVITINRM